MLTLFIITLLDVLLLYQRRHAIEAQRLCPDKLSNGDKNTISIKVKSLYSFPIGLKIIDEIPF
ncbi:MAG: DUF58 domain-containing protein, partial [Flammeovirgaceae bacterium]|nr:DUF58 domain-containing protein [Flammeovirgaceae bacterium]